MTVDVWMQHPTLRFLSHHKALEGLDALGLDDQARELDLDGNARRLFDL